MSILFWRNLAGFSTSLGCGKTDVMESYAIPLDVQCQIKALPEYSSAGLGHNSGGKSLKTSLIAISKDQVSISESEPESFEER